MNKSPYKYLNDSDLDIWNKAKNCNCDDNDCKSNHKLCALCQGTIIFNAYQPSQNNSYFSWNIDHIIPESKFYNNTKKIIWFKNLYNIESINSINNLQVVHSSCNEIKADRFNSNYENGFGIIN